jgi:hypothetical protein
MGNFGIEIIVVNLFMYERLGGKFYNETFGINVVCTMYDV